MRIYTEERLYNFKAWSGAVYTLETLTLSQIDELEQYLEELYPDGLGETELNDILWFEEEWIAELLGFESWEQLAEHNEAEQ